jgi:hypothetical protein
MVQEPQVQPAQPAQANITPEEARLKRALNQTWGRLSAKQKRVTDKEGKAWVEWKNHQFVDTERIQATRRRLEYIHRLVDGEKAKQI